MALVHTNSTLSGAVAQYGRGVGIIQITAAQIITQFANNLKAKLVQDGARRAGSCGRSGGGARADFATRRERRGRLNRGPPRHSLRRRPPSRSLASP